VLLKDGREVGMEEHLARPVAHKGPCARPP
jgi:hypothetical protein